MSLTDDLRRYLETIGGIRAGMAGRGTRGRTAVEEFRYPGVEAYLLERGRPYDPAPLTTEELDHLRAVAGGVSQYRQGVCYANAQTVASRDLDGRLVYCEGYAFGAVIPVLHAWLVLNGKVIDLTWRTGRREPRRFAPDRNLGSFDPWKYAYWGAEFHGVDWGRVWAANGRRAGSVFESRAALGLYRGEEPSAVLPLRGGRSPEEVAP